MMSISLAPHVTATETEHGMVLLDALAGRYWQTNATGALVLRCLFDGGTAESAAAQLRERFGSAAGDFLADVRKLISTLAAARMVIT